MSKAITVMATFSKDNLHYLKLSLESVLNQTEKNHQIILVKDGKLTHEQEEYLASINSRNLKTIQLELNRGLPAALNCGIKQAIKDGAMYVARMDADDISIENRLSEQIKYLEVHSEVDIVGSYAKLIDSNSQLIGCKKVKLNVTYNDMLSKCELIHPSVLFRKTFFDNIGFYDESLLKSQDYDLWLRALKKGVIIHNIPQFLISFRYESGLISRRKKEQKYNLYIKKKHLSGWEYYKSIIKPLFILLMPKFILRIILKQFTKTS